MKRTVAILAGAVVLAAGMYVSSRMLWAQPPAPAAATPQVQTRIALVNLNQVLKGYVKAQQYDEEFKTVYTAYTSDMDKLTKDIDAYTKQFQDPKTAQNPAQKDQIETYLKKLQRDRQDRKEDWEKKLTQKRQDQIVILYKDVEAMINALAKAKNIDLVFTYNDVANPADMYSPAIIARRLTTEACLPMYSAGGMNITKEVMDDLNWNVQRANQTQNGAAPAPANH